MESKQAGTKVQALDIGKCFNDAFDVYKNNIPTLILSALLFELISIGTLFILAAPLYGGLCLMMLNAAAKEDKKAELRDMFKMFNKFWPLLGLFGTQAVLIFLGFLLLIIPGFIFTTMWLFSYFIMVDRDKGVVDSLKGSWDMVSRNGFWINFAFCIIYLVLTVIPAQIPYAGLALGILILPFGVLMLTSAYIQQRPTVIPSETSEKEKPFADAVKKEEESEGV